MALEGKHNKGEWSELYVFFRLLAGGKLYSADECLNKRPDFYLEVLNIIREEVAGEITDYNRNPATSTVTVSIEGTDVATVTVEQFAEHADFLFDYIRNTKSKDGGILTPPEIVPFTTEIRVNSTSAIAGNGKNDIEMTLRDSSTSIVSRLGFSIKSQASQKSTLYNAGSGSQFIYEVVGMDDAGMKEFNSYEHYKLDKNGNRKFNKDGRPQISREWARCVEYYHENGLEAKFVRTARKSTATNMLFVRDRMAELLAWIFRHTLLEDRDRNDWRSIVADLEKANPLDYPEGSRLYEKAIKDFLYATFSGMTGTRAWDGVEQVNGGYIVVKNDGEVLCYQSSDRENFRQYLFDQTFVEYVGCHKYNWGYVVKEGDKFYLPMHASVRFYDKFKEWQQQA